MALIDIVGWVFFGIVVCCIIAGAVIFVKKVTLYPEGSDDQENKRIRAVTREGGRDADC